MLAAAAGAFVASACAGPRLGAQLAPVDADPQVAPTDRADPAPPSTTTLASPSEVSTGEFDAPLTSSSETDSWLFLGDSITVLSLAPGGEDLRHRVRAIDPSRSLRIVNRAIGGTNTGDALASIDRLTAGANCSFVVLGYGTNDYPPAFGMRSLVEAVIERGLTPVVPLIPWSPVDGGHARDINDQIREVHRRHRGVLRGPDLDAGFRDRYDLFPPADVHPTEEGRGLWRRLWAETIVGIDPDGPVPYGVTGPIQDVAPVVRLHSPRRLSLRS